MAFLAVSAHQSSKKRAARMEQAKGLRFDTVKDVPFPMKSCATTADCAVAAVPACCYVFYAAVNKANLPAFRKLPTVREVKGCPELKCPEATKREYGARCFAGACFLDEKEL